MIIIMADPKSLRLLPLALGVEDSEKLSFCVKSLYYWRKIKMIFIH